MLSTSFISFVDSSYLSPYLSALFAQLFQTSLILIDISSPPPQILYILVIFYDVFALPFFPLLAKLLTSEFRVWLVILATLSLPHLLNKPHPHNIIHPSLLGYTCLIGCVEYLAFRISFCHSG